MNTASPNDTKSTAPPTPAPTQTKMSPASPVEWWSGWSDMLGVSAAVIGGILAVITLLGWGFTWKAGKLKDEALEKYQQDSDVRISEANTKAAEANKAAAQAHERANVLEKQSASLQKDAAQARLELEQLKIKQAPRTLTQEQRKIFIAALSTLPKRVVKVISLSGNPEPMQWATQIRQCLNETGFGDPALVTPEYRLFGLTPNSDHTTSIVLHDAAEAQAYFDNRAANIAAAFEMASIRTQIVFLPQLANPGEVAVVIFEK